jgi:hypothetical protein
MKRLCVLQSLEKRNKKDKGKKKIIKKKKRTFFDSLDPKFNSDFKSHLLVVATLVTWPLNHHIYV